MNRRRFLVAASATAALAGTTVMVEAAGPAVRTFPVAGGALSYRRFGDRGPVHVLLSGGPGLESAYVDPVAAELARDRTIVVLDQRGTGASRDAFGNGSQVTVAGAVADLESLRTELDQTKLSLLGHSWGAMLSMAYAAAYPNRVAALALLDPGGPDPQFAKAFGQIIEARLTDADKTAADDATQKRGGEGSLRAILPGYFHDHAKGVAYAASLPQHYSNGDVNRAMFADIAAHYDVKDALRDTTIPALVVYGTDDPSRAAEAQLDALFPRATKVMIADAGHFPWIENPAPFYAAIRAFLAKLPPG
jgi:pimeloyl-ACP methyl ester carboxylesterase